MSNRPEIESLRSRAETTLGWAETKLVGILNRALDHLTLGRTWQLSALLESGESPLSHSSPVESADPERSEPQQSPIPNLESPTANAEHHLTQSVTLLRQAGQQQELPRGLLHRAGLWREMLALTRSPWQGEGVGDGRGTDRSEGGEPSEGSPAHPSPDLSPQRERDFYALADRDLSEAESIAKRGSMLIFQIEAALERSRQFLTLHEIG